MKLLIGLMAALMMNALVAGEQQILKVTNEEDSNVVYLYLETDENGDIVAMRHESRRKDGSLERTVREEAEKIYQGNGVLLKEHDGYEIIRLRSENFSSHQGGDIEIDTLYNGMNDTRRSYEFDLVRNGDEWQIEYRRKKIDKMHFKSKKVFLIGTVGIETIQIRGFSSIKPR